MPASLDSILDHRTFARGRIAECIVLPTTQELLVGSVPRNIAPTALVRLRSGAILMLRATGHAWTDGRLGAVAEVLSRQDVPNLGLGKLRRLLQVELSMPSLDIPARVSAGASLDQWPIAALSGVSPASAGINSGKRGKAAPGPHDLSARLVDALSRFIESLDPRATPLAMRGGELDVVAYNYFAHRLHGRYRRQFAMTFPLLADTVAEPGDGDDERAIRRAIDAGRPAIAEISRAWGVAPRIPRHLIGKPLDVVGVRWRDCLPDLARVLEALPSECLPGDTKEAWDAFNASVARAQRLSRGVLWQSWPALAVIREDLVGVRRKSRDAFRIEVRGERLAQCVEAFQHSAELALEVELEGRGVQPTPQIDAVIAQVVGELMGGLLRKGSLAQAAWNFEQRRTGLAREGDEERRELHEWQYWPLLKEPYLSRDGTRKVVSLDRDSEFREMAGVMGNCLWAKPEYRQAARDGSGTVLGILDRTTQEPASTAFVMQRRDPVQRRWTFKVAQHLAARNTPPSDACTIAVMETLLHCGTPGVQAHVERGAKLRESIEGKRGRQASRRFEWALLMPAMKAALGAERFEAAVERVRDLLQSPG